MERKMNREGEMFVRKRWDGETFWLGGESKGRERF